MSPTPQLTATTTATPWPTKDIIYISLLTPILLAALLEWILWLLAFLYALYKVHQKATGEQKWSIRILAILNALLFTGLRFIFLPIMMVTLPLPQSIVEHFPEAMVATLQWFAFWAFAVLLTVPWLFCVYQLVTHNLGREKRIRTVLDEVQAPKVVVVVPCYNEEPETLLRTVDSIVDCAYPPSCMHVFLSFDGADESEVYLYTLGKLGVPLTLERYPRSIDVCYRGCRVTVSRFKHGGKRSCQKHTFKLIDKVYAAYLRRNDDLFLLFIDSDCVLDRHCIQNFMWEMHLKPGCKGDMLAMTGVITSTTKRNSLLTMLQDMEYIHGQLFERSVESCLGAVTCLPGALTILRFSAFRRMARYYFADKAEQCDDLFDYGKCHLGEDRWLTHLFMIGAKRRYQIQMNTGAFCKTEAVQTLPNLLKQRRRWFLGFLTNEVCMLTDIRLWKRYPLLLLVRLGQNTIRTTALLFFIMIIALLSTSQKITNLPVGFIAVSLGLNWLLMLYFGAKLGRYKIMLYPLMFVINPFFNWLYLVNAIFTAGHRTWGGPRADAGKADENTTPAQAVVQAEKTGDELNIIPETFKPALEAKTHKTPHRTPLMPPHHLEQRFAPAEELPGGWYRQTNDSGVLYPDMARHYGVYPSRFGRTSMESTWSDQSTDTSVYTPRRVESIFAPEDASVYHERQALQLPAGGAGFESGSYGFRRDGGGGVRRNGEADESSEEVSLHFDIGPGPQVPRGRPANRPPQLITTTGNEALTFASTNPLPPTRRTQSLSNLDNTTGRSPLARKSFTRLASPPAQETGYASERLSTSQVGIESESRGRRWSFDSGRRTRRLSKQRR